MKYLLIMRSTDEAQMAQGPAAGLVEVDKLSEEDLLTASHLLPSVRGELLIRLGRHEEARAALGVAPARSWRPGPRRPAKK